MPQLQTVNLNPLPRTEPTNLERILSAAAQRETQDRAQAKDADILTRIYEQVDKQGLDLEGKIRSISTNKELSPTAKTNEIKNTLDVAKVNADLKKHLQAQMEADSKKKAEQQKQADAVKQTQLIEQQRGLESGTLASFASNPGLGERVTRPEKEPKKTQASQPINEDQLKRIQEVRARPEFTDASPAKKYQMLTDNLVSKENAKVEADIFSEDEKIANQAIDNSYKMHDKFINDITNSYKAFETDTKPKLLQIQKLASDGDVIGPTAAVFLDAFGIPLGALEDPSSELFQKLSLDLLKGLPETYGNRILKVEVENFLKTVPQLVNSSDGRRMIASNMLKLGEMKEVYYNAMRQEQQNYLDKNKPFPRDFQQRIFDQAKPRLDQINKDFVKLSEIRSVPSGTVPFFDPQGEVKFVPKEHLQWAEENEGRRIW